jgi:hypothetical protein
MMSTSPPSDSTGLQWLFNLAGAVITLLLSGYMALLQVQLSWLKADALGGETRLRDEINSRFDSIDKRDVERAAINAQRHQDNQAEQADTRAAVATRNQEDILERHRILDHLERLNTRLSSLPDRAEVREIVASMTRP